MEVKHAQAATVWREKKTDSNTVACDDALPSHSPATKHKKNCCKYFPIKDTGHVMEKLTLIFSTFFCEALLRISPK